MRARGLGDPLLVVSDGVAGNIKATETCFPRSERPSCLAHRMRNLAANAPEYLWKEFKARASATYQAPSRAIAPELAEGLARDYEFELPGAGQSSSSRWHHESAGAVVRRDAPPDEDHPQRLR